MSLNRLLFDSFDALIDSPTRSFDFGFLGDFDCWVSRFGWEMRDVL